MHGSTRVVRIALSCLVLGSVLVAEVSGTRFAAGTPWQAREQAMELERMLGWRWSADGKETLAKPYDEKSLGILLDAVNSPYPTVRRYATRLIRLVVEQLDVPENALDDIAREVGPLSEQEITDDMDSRKPTPNWNWEQGEAILRARRVLWQIGVKRLDSDEVRLAFFRDQLLGEKANSVEPYLKITVVECLGEMDVEEAKTILQDYLEASKRVHAAGRDRVRRAIEKVDVSRSLRPLEPSLKVEKLAEILEESPDLKMRVWAVREIGKVGNDIAISELQGILRNDHYAIQVRYEAQGALETLGSLGEDVRRIRFE